MYIVFLNFAATLADPIITSQLAVGNASKYCKLQSICHFLVFLQLFLAHNSVGDT